MGIGGVQEAVRSFFDNESICKFSVSVVTLNGSFNGDSINKNVDFFHGGYGINNPLSVIWLSYLIFRYKPDLVVCSLWRSLIIGLILRIFGINVVCFVHNEKFKNHLDYFVHRLCSRYISRFFVDSNKTKDSFSCIFNINKSRIDVISFLTKNIKRVEKKNKNNKYIFWGRLTLQKRIDRSLELFRHIHFLDNQAEFLLVGPIDLNGNRRFLEQNGVSYLGVKTWNEIQILAKNCSFFLQLSDYEGMAMSVVEAMQLGLVPVVTPVGAIPEYVTDKENGFIVCSDHYISYKNISEYLNNLSEEDYKTMSAKAHDTFLNSERYKDSFIKTVCLVIKEDSKSIH